MYRKGKTRDFISMYLGGIIFVMIIFGTSINFGQVLMRSVIEEKNSRIVEVIASSVTPFQMMAGKIVGRGLLVLTQVAIYLTVSTTAAAWSGMALPVADDLGWFLAYALAGYFLYAALFAAVGSIFETEQEAQQVFRYLKERRN